MAPRTDLRSLPDRMNAQYKADQALNGEKRAAALRALYEKAKERLQAEEAAREERRAKR